MSKDNKKMSLSIVFVVLSSEFSGVIKEREARPNARARCVIGSCSCLNSASAFCTGIRANIID